MPELVSPTARLHRQWLAARDEWGRGVYQDGSGVQPGDELDSFDGFAAFVRKLLREADPGVPPPTGWVHCTYWWMAEGDEILGSIALRHALNETLAEVGGHIGYSVRPSARGHGLAGRALRCVLPYAWTLGLPGVLLTCMDTNHASRRTIEGCGGRLEDVRDTLHGPMRRYWIRPGSSS